MLENISTQDAIDWIDLNTPLTQDALADVSQKTYGHVAVACASHIEPKFLTTLLRFAKAGVHFDIMPCVPGIAHAPSFQYLRDAKITAVGEDARSWLDLERLWDLALDRKPDFIFDIGGGLIRRAIEREVPVRAACEATSTGVEIVKNLETKFPVFNWNDVPVKNLMHNRYEVGSGIWYAFRKLTGLDLCRLRVGVLGYGLVGQSVASTARGLGAQVYVADLDPLRNLTASSDGFATLAGPDVARVVDVLVSATGVRATVTSKLLAQARDGLIVLNAGHDSRDIELTDLFPAVEILPGITRVARAGRSVFLLADGKLLNLAAGGGSAVNTFDLVTALITKVIDFMLTEGAAWSPGLHDVPEYVSAEIIKSADRRGRLTLG